MSRAYRKRGAVVAGKSYVDGELQAEIDLMFAYLGTRFEGVEQFDPVDFLVLLRTLCVFSVGRRPDGSPVPEPAHLVDVEKVRLNESSTS